MQHLPGRAQLPRPELQTRHAQPVRDGRRRLQQGAVRELPRGNRERRPRGELVRAVCQGLHLGTGGQRGVLALPAGPPLRQRDDVQPVRAGHRGGGRDGPLRALPGGHARGGLRSRGLRAVPPRELLPPRHRGAAGRVQGARRVVGGVPPAQRHPGGRSPARGRAGRRGARLKLDVSHAAGRPIVGERRGVDGRRGAGLGLPAGRCGRGRRLEGGGGARAGGVPHGPAHDPRRRSLARAGHARVP
mmetsp:Transcript_16914/g.57792  ORF Transcript_16914/g.57792 Transcript_16914/m.57792 type:complete len:245 (-) Transcript_16914:485-1219(-)